LAKKRIQTWLALVILAPLLIALFVMGLWAYMTFTATPIHPDAQNIPSVPQSIAATNWADAVSQGRQIVRAALSGQNLPGVSVAVGVDGEIAWAEGFGFADLETKTPVAPDMTFRIGTASTVLTSAGAGLLLESGRLKLDGTIQTYVPEFPEKQWPVTLRQVMAHTAGIRSDGGDEGPLFTQHCDRPAEALQYFKDGALLFEPGTNFQFSRYGWILVSAAIEKAADEAFLSFMRREVFEPLGMDHTEADSTTVPISNRVSPYFPRFAADPRYGPDPMRPLDYSCYAGSSVFLSTPSDLVRFGMGINGGQLLQPSTVQTLQTSQRLPSGQGTGYGLGWDLETVSLGGKETTALGHDGDSLGGMVASLMTFRDLGIVVAVTSNTSYADTAGIALKIAQAFAGQMKHPAGK
jgi:CubicO group peptidase (beta-lactamase class C family)